MQFCNVSDSFMENVNLETSNVSPDCVSSSTKNIAVLLLAKGITDVFTCTCCFSYYFKARQPNHRSCRIVIVRQLRTDCPNSPSSVVIFPFCIYIVLFTVSLSWSQHPPLSSSPTVLLPVSPCCFRAGPFLCT